MTTQTPSMPPQLNIYACVTVVAYTLLSYDYALTIAQEIEVFWQRPKRSWTFALFLSIDMSPSLVMCHNSYICSCHQKLDWTIVCDSLDWVSQIVVIVIQITGGVIMTIRVYTIYQNSRPVLIFLVVLMFVGTIVGCWAISSTSSASSGPMALLPPLTGNVECLSGAYRSSEQAVYQAAAWTGQLVFDFVVFLLTLIRSLQIRKERSQSIIDIFLRDGSLYFAVMCGANIANIIILLIAPNSLKALVSSFVSVVSATLISRLMLNIRDLRVTDPMGSSLYSLSHANMVFAMLPTGSQVLSASFR
ncbi:hypothetical protein V8B97DRAFT_155978 [Scleroderma yunnanense]